MSHGRQSVGESSRRSAKRLRSGERSYGQMRTIQTIGGILSGSLRSPCLGIEKIICH